MGASIYARTLKIFVLLLSSRLTSDSLQSIENQLLLFPIIIIIMTIFISSNYNYTDINSYRWTNDKNHTEAFYHLLTNITDGVHQVTDMIQSYHHNGTVDFPMSFMFNVNNGKFNIMNYIFQLLSILLLMVILILLLIYLKKTRIPIVQRKQDQQSNNSSLDDHPSNFDDIDLNREMVSKMLKDRMCDIPPIYMGVLNGMVPRSLFAYAASFKY